MKTPIKYWGGKQSMVQHILPLIPVHTCYIEPFCGGAAVFFAKALAKNNILSDTNKWIINLYKVLQNDEKRIQLQQMLKETPYARTLYLEAYTLWDAGDLTDDVRAAWAYFVGLNQCFMGALSKGSWGRTTKARNGLQWQNKIKEINENICNKIKNAQIDNRDALKLLGDTHSKCFIYLDPPYVDTCSLDYKGYSRDEFNKLLEILRTIPAKWLLSHYTDDALIEWATQLGYEIKSIETIMSSSSGTGAKDKKKTELLIYNYKLDNERIF